MKVFSPSFKRSNGVKTHKILSDVIYVVGESEKQEYEDHGYNVQSIPDEINGNIARVRNYIKDNFIKDKGVMIDDDIEDVRRWNYKDDKFVAESINLQEFIEKSFVLCEEWDCRLFGVNIVGDKGSYREYSPFSLNSWISVSFMGFLNNECSFDERIPLKEDLDMSVQVLNKYRRLLRFNYVHLMLLFYNYLVCLELQR